MVPPAVSTAPKSSRADRIGERLAKLSTSAWEIGRLATELILPSTCRMCDACVGPGEDFCDACGVRLLASDAAMRSACLRCGRPGAAGASPAGANTAGANTAGGRARPAPCDQCRGERFAFDRCIALWTYDGLVRNAVISAKYGSQMALAHALGRRLAGRVCDHFCNPGHDESPQVCACDEGFPDVVTPVPSHWLRRIQRGGGGSRIVAEAVSRSLRAGSRLGSHRGVRSGLPRCPYVEWLRTTRRIQKQAWLGEKDRIANVRGAFRVVRSRWPAATRDHVRGKHVLLVDDVMTTGATSSEIARVLKLSGAVAVTVAVVARAV